MIRKFFTIFHNFFDNKDSFFLIFTHVLLSEIEKDHFVIHSIFLTLTYLNLTIRYVEYSVILRKNSCAWLSMACACVQNVRIRPKSFGVKHQRRASAIYTK